jgi:hypothetical protein
MKDTESVEHTDVEADDMETEYSFDYSKAKPNRFADKIGGDQLMVFLDPDVAAVFKTSESVNKVLRAIIISIPMIEKEGN